MADGLDLGKQIGPLPLGAWVAVVATGVGITVWTRRGLGGSSTADPAPVEDQWSSTGTGVDGQWVDVTPPDPQTDTAPADNESWGARSVAWLIAQNYDPAMSQTAITKALREGHLSVREYALWWIALRHFGPPPYAVAVAIPKGFKPPDGTPKTPPRVHQHMRTPAWYSTRPGDSLRRVARKAYNDESKWHRIYEANRKGVRRPNGSHGWIVDPNKPLPAGRFLYVPKG